MATFAQFGDVTFHEATAQFTLPDSVEDLPECLCSGVADNVLLVVVVTANRDITIRIDGEGVPKPIARAIKGNVPVFVCMIQWVHHNVIDPKGLEERDEFVSVGHVVVSAANLDTRSKVAVIDLIPALVATWTISGKSLFSKGSPHMP